MAAHANNREPDQRRRVGRISPRAAALLSWSLGIFCAVLLASTLLLFALNLLHPDVEVYGLWVQDTVVAATFPALGLLIASRRPGHPIGWLFCAAGLLGGLDHFCGEYAIYALLAQPGSLPAGQAAAWGSTWLYVPSGALLVYVTLLFPDGRMPLQRWRPVACHLVPLRVVRQGVYGAPIFGGGLFFGRGRFGRARLRVGDAPDHAEAATSNMAAAKAATKVAVTNPFVTPCIIYSPLFSLSADPTGCPNPSEEPLPSVSPRSRIRVQPSPSGTR